MHKYQTQTARTYRIDKDMLPGMELAAARYGMNINQFVNAAISVAVIEALRTARGEGR